MDQAPSDGELYFLFVQQVRAHKPLARTIELLDRKVLPGFKDPPTYACYVKLCWDHVEMEQRDKARDAITGHSSGNLTPLDPKPKPKP